MSLVVPPQTVPFQSLSQSLVSYVPYAPAISNILVNMAKKDFWQRNRILGIVLTTFSVLATLALDSRGRRVTDSAVVLFPDEIPPLPVVIDPYANLVAKE